MGIFSKFENKMEDAIDGLGDKLFDSPISPVQIAKKAEKQMRRNKMVGAGKQYAPTLYTVLVNKNDDARLFGYYPTLAGETETYLKAKADEAGFAMDGEPLVRFIVDDDLKPGKFDVIAEAVAGEIIGQLREEENARYGVGALNRAPQAEENLDSSSVAYQAPVVNNPINNSKVSSPFAPINEQNVNPIDSAVNPQPAQNQNNPVSEVAQVPNNNPINPAPLNTNAPIPEPAVAVPPMPQPVNAVDSSQQNIGTAQNANTDIKPDSVPAPNPIPAPVSSSAETAVFAGGFDVASQPNQAQNNVASVPTAILYEAATGRSYQITSSVNVLGRDDSCNIVIADANASRQHAQITYNQGLWMINDLGSTNGTFVNNQEVTTREIRPGDLITIGVTKLTFNLS